MLFYIKETPNTLLSNTLSTTNVVSTPTKRKLDDVSIFSGSKKLKTETKQSNDNVNTNILSHLQNNVKSDTLNSNKQKDNLTNTKNNQKEAVKINTQSKLKEKEENVVKMLLNQSNNPYKITGGRSYV